MRALPTALAVDPRRWPTAGTRADPAQVDAVVEEAGPHLGGRHNIAGLRRAQHGEDVLAFASGALVRRCRPWRRARHRRATAPIDLALDAPSSSDACLVDVTASRFLELLADHRFDLGTDSALPESCSKSACTFP